VGEVRGAGEGRQACEQGIVEKGGEEKSGEAGKEEGAIEIAIALYAPQRRSGHDKPHRIF
jgi:hypothetical protein